MLLERIKLEADEKILLIVRKHWWIIFTRVFSAIIATIAPVVLLVIFDAMLDEVALFTDFIASNLALAAFGYQGWILLNWIAIANFWTDHYLDLWAITNRRIVSIDQQGFFRRRLSSFRLERLQDMNINVSGIIATLLNFGTIEAQTAGGSNEEFKTNNMPDPRGLKALIIQAADARQHATQQALLNQDGTL